MTSFTQNFKYCFHDYIVFDSKVDKILFVALSTDSQCKDKHILPKNNPRKLTKKNDLF